ncbi:hemerythrin domain-containing protein [Serinicoccus sediminis]|uniref:hemerythrin domain-containing protein n=1 Tax=Serinicoccus sediminis TaxID=2306021 RepID=UPI00101F1714|nr:hemerythrin domain-containing protein [Serinicoccus sediminis]
MTSLPTEPLLLPGQAAAPPGPCDMTGMYVMHHAFRRDLARFASAVHATPVASRPTWEALLTRWDLFARELHHHHTKEDEGIWPLLLERADDPGRVVLEAMEAEHGSIDPLLDQVREGLCLLANRRADGGADATRTDLRRAVVTLGEVLDAHLAHEEVDAIRLIQQHITAAEWEHLEATVLRGKPSPGQMLFMLPWVVDELPRAGVDRLLTGAPAPVRWLLALGRRRYTRLDRRAFAYC